MKVIKPMTDKERRVLDFVSHHIQGHGYAPTLQEIIDGAEISSKSVVAYQLDRLEERGLIQREDDKARSIKLRVLPGPTDPEKLFKPLDIDDANDLKRFIAQRFPSVCPLIQAHGDGFAVLIVAR